MPSAARPPRGIALRPATLADLADCERVWREALNDYLGPLGVPETLPDNPGVRRLHAHTLTTDPERFWVAERRGRVVAFGSALQRPPLWYLSMLFVQPDEQSRGLGRALLARLLPDPIDGAVLATSTDSAQPVANALYTSLGMAPRLPLFNLIGRVRADHGLPPLPPDLTVEPLGPADQLAELDRELLGFAHPVDHELVVADGRLGFAFRDDLGRLVGYGYASRAGRVGPIAVVDRGLLPAVLGHVLVSVEPRGASSVWISGDAPSAMAAAIRAGFQIDGFPVLLCWNRPFADFGRYVPTSPGLL
jgi:GNAT superfamily N-acetyltransferase